MMSVKKKLFERVEKIPPRKFGEKVKVYSEVLAAIQKEGKGIYKISIPDKKPKTIYIALAKRIKEERLVNLKLHDRSGNIYIEVTE